MAFYKIGKARGFLYIPVEEKGYQFNSEYYMKKSKFRE